MSLLWQAHMQMTLACDLLPSYQVPRPFKSLHRLIERESLERVIVFILNQVKNPSVSTIKRKTCTTTIIFYLNFCFGQIMFIL